MIYIKCNIYTIKYKHWYYTKYYKTVSCTFSCLRIAVIMNTIQWRLYTVNWPFSLTFVEGLGKVVPDIFLKFEIFMYGTI